MQATAYLVDVRIGELGVQRQGDLVLELGQGIGEVGDVEPEVAIGREQRQGLVMHVGGNAVLGH